MGNIEATAGLTTQICVPKILSLALSRSETTRIFFICFVLCLAKPGFSQKIDTTQKINHFSAAASVTNNGIAFIPAFSLGKPAMIFDMSAGRRLSFDPQFRFSLDAKPWTFLFSWRYKLIAKNKLKLTVGAHPTLNFRTVSITTTDNVAREYNIVRRYMTGDLATNYFFTKNTSVGIYNLYAHRLDKNAIKNAFLFGVNSSFSNLKLFNQFFARLLPQVYYLKQVEDDGFYVTSTLVLLRKNFPLSISSILNKAIRTDIPGSPDFAWNVILTYSFSKFYVEK